MSHWRNLAEEMVREQIEGRGVRGAVLEAMASVPRHLFVSENLAENAWIDSPLPIGEDQTISQPYMVGRMTELLAPSPGERVLEVGTGSGYQAAVLCAMGVKVVTMERIKKLALESRERLARLGYDAEVLWTDGSAEDRPEGPFDGVIVTAAAPELERWWTDVLAKGGRLVAPVSVMSGGQRLLLRKKLGNGRIKDTWHEYCRFVPLLKGKKGDEPLRPNNEPTNGPNRE
ncbi:MAG: protein-L-isoaspartate(D-aspartate) O-methyltransferase [Aminivibrio sp.]